MLNQKKSIGVLIPTVDQYYQTELWHAIVKEAENLDYNILFFCGSVLDSPIGNEKQNNIMYNLATKGGIDGIISITGTLFNYSEKEKFERFFKKFNKVPVIHISYSIEEANCIVVDNYSSMEKMVNHIITEHDYKNYVYVSGPNTNTESVSRKKAFVDVMKENRIADKNFMILEGDFSKESSMKAIKNMYDQGLFSPDVIICANDEMAIGTLNILKQYGIETPDKVAFTGFDNVSDATTFSPSFTTMSQPLAEMGKAAVVGINQLLTQKDSSINKSFGANLIIRESCGCFSSSSYKNNLLNEELLHKTESSDEEFLESLITEIKDRYLQEYFLKNRGTQEDKYLNLVEKLLETLVDELQNRIKKGSCLKFFYKLAKKEFDSSVEPFDWNMFIKWFKKKLYDLGASPLPEVLHDILFDTTNYAEKLTIRKIRQENYDFMGMYYYSSELIMELTRVMSQEDMFKAIIPYLRAYKFEHYYICLFKEPLTTENLNTFVYPAEIMMAFGFENGHIYESYWFEADQMMPGNLMKDNEQVELIYYPIVFGPTHYGYHISSVSSATKPMFRTIKEQVANTLERLKVHEKLKEYNRQLVSYNEKLSTMAISDTLTNVFNRRGIYDNFERLTTSPSNYINKIGIVYGDIDNLKPINDVYGHQEGDKAIVAIANILKKSLRGPDILGRVGGDEFVCLILNPNESNFGEAYGQKVKDLLEEYNNTTNAPYQVDISLGFSVWDRKNNQTIDDVFRESDEKLYQVKRQKKKSIKYRLN